MMKKFLEFIGFFAFLGFCWLAFGAVEARDSKNLAAELERSQEQVVLGEKQIEALRESKAKLQAELDELKSSEETAPESAEDDSNAAR